MTRNLDRRRDYVVGGYPAHRSITSGIAGIRNIPMTDPITILIPSPTLACSVARVILRRPSSWDTNNPHVPLRPSVKAMERLITIFTTEIAVTASFPIWLIIAVLVTANSTQISFLKDSVNASPKNDTKVCLSRCKMAGRENDMFVFALDSYSTMVNWTDLDITRARAPPSTPIGGGPNKPNICTLFKIRLSTLMRSIAKTCWEKCIFAIVNTLYYSRFASKPPT